MEALVEQKAYFPKGGAVGYFCDPNELNFKAPNLLIETHSIQKRTSTVEKLRTISTVNIKRL